MIHSPDAASALAEATRLNGSSDYPTSARLAAAVVARCGYPALADAVLANPASAADVGRVVAAAEARAADVGSDMLTVTHLLDALDEAGAVDAGIVEHIRSHENATAVTEILDGLTDAAISAAHLDCLPRRQAAFTAARYGLDGQTPMRLAQVAEHFGLSREAGRQILKGAEATIGAVALQRAAAAARGFAE